MKKILAVLLIAAALSGGNALAYEYDGDLIVNTLTVNVSDGTVVKNDEAVESITAPYINENGTSMMEFYTLAEAMGAEATDDGEMLTVKFGGVEMTYALNSTRVLVNGQELSMPSAPVRSDEGVIMVPIRFVAEAMGADVTYDGETGEIVIVSSGDLDDGLDFDVLFKYSAKTKIGNSRLHWRFEKTSNFDMSESYMKNRYEFAMDDIWFEFTAYKNEQDKNIEVLYYDLQNKSSYYYDLNVMYDKGMGDLKGVPYAYVKKRSVDTIYEYYVFMTDDYVYYIDLERGFESFAAAENNSSVDAFLNSLEFDYYGGDDESTVDLAVADLAAENEKKDEYTDGNYSWSIKLDDTWTVDEYYGFYNVVTVKRDTEIADDDTSTYSMFDYYSDGSATDPWITIKTLSNSENQSLDSWVWEVYQQNCNFLNTEKNTVSAIEDTTVNGIAAKTFQMVYENDENKNVFKYYYLNDDYYRYIITLTYDEREEQTEGFLESANNIIQSFTPGDINREEVGNALEAENKNVLLSVLSEYDGDKYKFSYPCTWEIEEGSNGVSISSNESLEPELIGIINAVLPQYTYAASSVMSGGGLFVFDEKLSYYNDNLELKSYTVEEYMKKKLAAMLNSNSALISYTMNGEIEDTKVASKDAYKVEMSVYVMSEGSTDFTVYYIPNDEESVTVMVKSCSEEMKNTAYETALNNLFDSFIFK